jgi:hypothetical protein
MRAQSGFGSGHLVARLVELLGGGVLLIPCRCGTKVPSARWGEVGPESMDDPKYLRRLERSNIGVVLGQRSGGLCTLDIDSDEESDAFRELNPQICDTLCTRGARGCNWWWRMTGYYPALTPIKRDGCAWGEWRSDGGQTIISGLHPSGEHYRILRRKPPLMINFGDIQWLPSTTPVFENPSEGHGDTERTENTQITEPPQNTQCTQPTQNTDGTEVNRGGKGVCVWPSGSGCVFTVEQALAAARTRGPGGNHECLFTLARGLKAAELSRGSAFPEGELREVFERWFADAKPHVKKELGIDDYWFEFMEGYENVVHPLGEGVVETVWAKTAGVAPPSAAGRYADLNLQRVVSFCREMWLFRNRQPFFISCRTLQRLLEHGEHVRAARWLRGLVRDKILAIEEAGSATSRRATRYRYLPED